MSNFTINRAPIESITITLTPNQYSALVEMFSLGLEEGWLSGYATEVRNIFIQINKEINK